MQSLPAWNTIEQFTQPSDRDTSSVVMKVHQKNPLGYYKLGSYIDRYFRKPRDFESYAYVTQCLQAYTMKHAIETQRSKMPYCMGTLYWQLNDCWPVASWSTVDGHGRWKAAHYAVRKAYDDILFGVSVNEKQYTIYVANDSREIVSKRMKASLIDFEGRAIWEKVFELNRLPWGSQTLLTIDSATLFKGAKPANTYMQFVSFDSGSQGEYVTSNIVYFSRPKDQQLQKASFRLKQLNGNQIEITSDVLARYVWVDIPGVDHHLSDNFFDLLPGETVRLEVKTAKPLKNVVKLIRIKSLVDSYIPDPVTHME
jgi:beta-mannosidase